MRDRTHAAVCVMVNTNGPRNGVHGVYSCYLITRSPDNLRALSVTSISTADSHKMEQNPLPDHSTHHQLDMWAPEELQCVPGASQTETQTQ